MKHKSLFFSFLKSEILTGNEKLVFSSINFNSMLYFYLFFSCHCLNLTVVKTTKVLFALGYDYRDDFS